MTSTFKRYDQMDADFFRRIILGEDVETNEDPVQADTTRPMGLMTPETGVREPSLERALGPRDPSQRMDPNLRSTSDNILTRAASALGAFSTDRQQVADAIVPRQEDLPQIDLSEWESLPPLEDTLDLRRSAAIDAQLQAMNRDAVGIRESLRPTQEPDAVNVEQSTQGAGIEMVPADEQPTEDTPVVNGTDVGGSDVDAKAASTRESIDATSFGTLKIGDERTSIPEATHLTTMFDGLADVEGDFNHVDGRGYFTMPYGVVPDNGSVKRADGTAFNPRSGHGYTTDTAGSVDTSNATHTLSVGSNSYTVRRSDYDSDEAFARGVVSLYNREAENVYGEGWDDLTEGARSMALDMAWNGGVGAVGWSSVRNAMQEAGKENPSTETLFGFTANMRSGINYPRGLFKRRLIQYNMIANPEDAASTYSTEALTRDGERVGTRYIAHRADGTNIGSWDRYDVADNPATEANEKRVASNEVIEANVGLD